MSELVEVSTPQTILEVTQDVTVVEIVAEPTALVEVVEDALVLEVTPATPAVVEVLSGGLQGPPGPPGADSTVPGPPGPPGAPGSPGSAPQAYTHDQTVPSAVWTIAHNLGYRPAVTTQDSAGTWVVGDLSHLDANTAVVTFLAAFGGKAYCS